MARERTSGNGAGAGRRAAWPRLALTLAARSRAQAPCRGAGRSLAPRPWLSPLHQPCTWTAAAARAPRSAARAVGALTAARVDSTRAKRPARIQPALLLLSLARSLYPRLLRSPRQLRGGRPCGRSPAGLAHTMRLTLCYKHAHAPAQCRPVARATRAAAGQAQRGVGRPLERRRRGNLARIRRGQGAVPRAARSGARPIPLHILSAAFARARHSRPALVAAGKLEHEAGARLGGAPRRRGLAHVLPQTQRSAGKLQARGDCRICTRVPTPPRAAAAPLLRARPARARAALYKPPLQAPS